MQALSSFYRSWIPSAAENNQQKNASGADAIQEEPIPNPIPADPIEDLMDSFTEITEASDNPAQELDFLNSSMHEAGEEAKVIRNNLSDSIILGASEMLSSLGAINKNNLTYIKNCMSFVSVSKDKRRYSELALKLMPLARPSNFVETCLQNEDVERKKEKIKGITESIKEKEAAKVNSAEKVNSADQKELNALYFNLFTEERRLLTLAKPIVPGNFEVFIESVLGQVPNLSLAKKATLSCPVKNDLNNNGMYIKDGWTVDFSANPSFIDRDGVDFPLYPATRIQIGGEWIQLEGFFEPSTRMLYSSLDDARYHDDVIVSGGQGKPVLMTLTDGSGHDQNARPIAKSIAGLAHDYANTRLNRCKDIHSALEVLIKGVKHAVDVIEEMALNPNKKGLNDGATTFIQAAMIDNVLTGVFVGDSALVVFRPNPNGQGWTVLDPLQNAKGTLDAKDAGAQLSGSPRESDLHAISAFAMLLEEGDVVFMGSDGYFDNFNPILNHQKVSDLDPKRDEQWGSENPTHLELANQYAKKKLEDVVQDCESGEDIHRSLQRFITKNTHMKKMQLFTKPQVMRPYPGKLDDAASCCVVHTQIKA